MPAKAALSRTEVAEGVELVEVDGDAEVVERAREDSNLRPAD